LKDKKLYIGYSENLKRRIVEHEHGEVKSTQDRRPFVLIHYEAFSSIKDGKAREKFLKSGFGRDQLKQELKNKLNELGYKYL
jgi:putative endonuclease